MIDADPGVRDNLLRIAANFSEDRTDTAAVMANAEPLLAWVQEAPDTDDGGVRYSALSRLDINRAIDREPTTPTEFLKSAQSLYEFLTGN